MYSTHRYMQLCIQLYIHSYVYIPVYASPKNGEVTLLPNTRVVKWKCCVSRKRNEANDKGQWCHVLLAFIS